MEPKFYVCKHCGNIVAFVKSSGVPIICCGEAMQELKPNAIDAAQEKHLPVISYQQNCVVVQIGSVPHPMTEEHYIEWVCLHTTQGNQRKCLKPGDKPEVHFTVCEDDEPIAALAYWNLHGLWKTEK